MPARRCAWPTSACRPSPRDLALRPHGLTLVTGRAGSGKTTTLAAMAEEVNAQRSVHLLTIEDPIEILIPEKSAVVTQREILSDVETFGSALRAAMRQDPERDRRR